MPRRKKVKVKELETLYAQCPIRGHRHILELVTDPDRPDLLVAYCDGRAVVRQANPEIHPVIEKQEPPVTTTYKVPSYSDLEGE